jgi:Fe-S-cluster-containing dehydrogenase component
MRLGMVIDLKRCIGCYACQIACKAEHATPPGVLYARVVKQEVGIYPNARKTTLPLLCMHCADPPCVKVCPTGATTKRADGIVDVDANKCVGCRYCMMACPYGARFFNDEVRAYFPGNGLTPYEEQGYKNHPTGVVEKCNFCSERLERHEEPACVANCPAKARIFGDLDDPSTEVSMLIRSRPALQLHPELGTDPSVYYLPS